ncbi:hypothetical protein NQZ68_013744 [Dissostichus eleginoides]|nr:hypothetical protein NQZ68_013744 [Dissostichus eleginoides]
MLTSNGIIPSVKRRQTVQEREGFGGLLSPPTLIIRQAACGPLIENGFQNGFSLFFLPPRPSPSPPSLMTKPPPPSTPRSIPFFLGVPLSLAEGGNFRRTGREGGREGGLGEMEHWERIIPQPMSQL